MVIDGSLVLLGDDCC